VPTVNYYDPSGLTHVEAFGLAYDPAMARRPEVAQAQAASWDGVPTRMVNPVGLVAIEEQVNRIPIDQVVAGEPLRPGYPVKLALIDGRLVIIDGHHRAAMHSAMGRQMEALVLDLSRQAAHPVAIEADDDLDDHGGFSVRTLTGHEPTTGWMVAIPGSERVYDSAVAVTPEIVESYMAEFANVLDDPDNHMGGWVDTTTGKVYLDISRHTPSEAEAIRLGREYNQLAVFDLGTGRTVRLAGAWDEYGAFDSRNPWAKGETPFSEKWTPETRRPGGISRGPWLHFSRYPLPLGTVLTPHGPGGRAKHFDDLYEINPERAGYVYLTLRDDYYNWEFIGDYVYRVEPLGEVIDLTEILDDTEGRQYGTSSARVVGIERQPTSPPGRTVEEADPFVLVADRRHTWTPSLDRGRMHGWYHISPKPLPLGTVLVPQGPDGKTINFDFFDYANDGRGGKVFITDWAGVNLWDSLIPETPGAGGRYIYRVEPLAEVREWDESQWVTSSARVVEVVEQPMTRRDNEGNPGYALVASANVLASEDYRGQHQPSGTYGAPMHDLTVLMPEDIYTHPHYYPGFDEYPELVRLVQQARGNPDLPVKVYRAVPPGVSTINPGDWVTPAKGYAEQMTYGLMGPAEDGSEDGVIVERTVKARELVFPGDYGPEWGWFPNNSLGKRLSLKAEDVYDADHWDTIAISGQWFHASTVPMPIGTILSGAGPGKSKSNFDDFYRDVAGWHQDHVWLWPSVERAVRWVWDFFPESSNYVYRVEPLGKVTAQAHGAAYTTEARIVAIEWQRTFSPRRLDVRDDLLIAKRANWFMDQEYYEKEWQFTPAVEKAVDPPQFRNIDTMVNFMVKVIDAEAPGLDYTLRAGEYAQYGGEAFVTIRRKSLDDPSPAITLDVYGREMLNRVNALHEAAHVILDLKGVNFDGSYAHDPRFQAELARLLAKYLKVGLELSWASKTATTYYHGSGWGDGQPGERLLTGVEFDPADSDRDDVVWMTTDLENAKRYAEMWGGETGESAVYEVRPIGEPRPGVEGEYKASGAEIIRRVAIDKTATDWDRQGWFHASPYALPLGTILQPGGAGGRNVNFGDLYENSLDYGWHDQVVWITDSLSWATEWIQSHVPGFIYRVEPMGRVTGGAGLNQFFVDRARVVEVIDQWAWANPETADVRQDILVAKKTAAPAFIDMARPPQTMGDVKWNQPPPRALYHGSPRALPLGTVVTPGGPGGQADNYRYDSSWEWKNDWVFLTDSIDDAAEWATMASRPWPTKPEEVFVYRVEPMGEVVNSMEGEWVTPAARVVECVRRPRDHTLDLVAALSDEPQMPEYTAPMVEVPALYHGTGAALPLGSVITPNGTGGEGPVWNYGQFGLAHWKKDWVFMTGTINDARYWATFHDSPYEFVYEVEPLGAVHKTSGENEFITPSARVVKLVYTSAPEKPQLLTGSSIDHDDDVESDDDEFSEVGWAS
jgi:hypothetical protein